jgi:hypothetical protein
MKMMLTVAVDVSFSMLASEDFTAIYSNANISNLREYISV